jgi:hypothetical protein
MLNQRKVIKFSSFSTITKNIHTCHQQTYAEFSCPFLHTAFTFFSLCMSALVARWNVASAQLWIRGYKSHTGTRMTIFIIPEIVSIELPQPVLTYHELLLRNIFEDSPGLFRLWRDWENKRGCILSPATSLSDTGVGLVRVAKIRNEQETSSIFSSQTVCPCSRGVLNETSMRAAKTKGICSNLRSTSQKEIALEDVVNRTMYVMLKRYNFTKKAVHEMKNNEFVLPVWPVTKTVISVTLRCNV